MRKIAACGYAFAASLICVACAPAQPTLTLYFHEPNGHRSEDISVSSEGSYRGVCEGRHVRGRYSASAFAPIAAAERSIFAGRTRQMYAPSNDAVIQGYVAVDARSEALSRYGYGSLRIRRWLYRGVPVARVDANLASALPKLREPCR